MSGNESGDVLVSEQLGWRGFMAAVGAEPREAKQITGASGLIHSVKQIGVDDKNKRIIVISNEPSARQAALVQLDIQSTLPDSKVIVARPITIDLAHIIRKLLEPIDTSTFSAMQIKKAFGSISQKPKRSRFARTKAKSVDPAVEAAVRRAFSNDFIVKMPPIETLISVAMQLDQVPWQDIYSAISEERPDGIVDFSRLVAKDTMTDDMSAGICPVPLYDFVEDDIRLFSDISLYGDAVARLKELGIYQYFFPPCDQLSLGLVDSGIGDVANIFQGIDTAKKIGHPLGDPEIIFDPYDLPEILSQLKEKGYLAEGEFGFELSDAGRAIRQTVKFRPREGLLTKILNRISVSVSPGDFIK